METPTAASLEGKKHQTLWLISGKGHIANLLRFASAGGDTSSVCKLDTEPQIVVNTGRDPIRPVIVRTAFINESPRKQADILAGHETFLSLPELKVEYESRWMQHQPVKSETEPLIMEKRVGIADVGADKAQGWLYPFRSDKGTRI